VTYRVSIDDIIKAIRVAVSCPSGGIHIITPLGNGEEDLWKILHAM